MTTLKITFDKDFMEKASKVMDVEAKAMLDEVASLMQSNVRKNLVSRGIKDTGHLINSYQRDVKLKNGKGLAVVGSNALYALPMELGITKRYYPSKLMIESIRGWVRRKLRLSGKEADRAASAISWKIARKGLSDRFPSYAVRDAFNEGSKRVAQLIDRHMTRAFATMERFR